MFELPDGINFSVEAEQMKKEDAVDTELRHLLEDFGEFDDEFIKAIKGAPTFTQVQTAIMSVKDDLKRERPKLSAMLEEKARITREIDDLQAETARRVAEMRIKKNALENAIFEQRRKITALEAEHKSLYRQMQMAIDALVNSRKYKDAVVKYDSATVGKIWRDKAFPYQIQGAQILATAERAILADEMGLGKTLTLLATLDMLQSKKVLIVCPADQTSNFEREAKKWAPDRPVFSLYKQPPGVRSALLQIYRSQDQFCILTNYDAWRKDDSLVTQLSEMGFDTVICDEAHNIKEASTSAFKGVRDIVMASNCCGFCYSINIERYEIEPGARRYRWRCNEATCNWDSSMYQKYTVADRRSVKHVYPTTGTPILNRPQELFTLLHLILPEVFEKESDFLTIYCEQNWAGYWEWKEGAKERLVEKHLSGRYLARTEKELSAAGIKIPDQTIHYDYLDLTEEAYPEQYKIIQQINKHAQIVLANGHKMSMINKLEIYLRLRQANVWPGGIKIKDDEGNIVWSVGDEVHESIKMDWAYGLLDTFTMTGNRCVVFSQFKDPLHELQKRLTDNGIKAVVYDGSTPQIIREQVQIDFDRKYCDVGGYEPKWDVVLCNYRTGGVGLNFTAATRTIVTDEEWNPGKNSQAWRRTKRIGQTEETQVHICRINGTVDAWLAKLIEHKAKIVDGFTMSAQEMQDELLKALEGDDFIK